VVSYATEVKRRALGVTAANVISAECAEQMAAGVRNLLGADVSVAVTGVGGPDDQEGEPPGTVWLAVNDGTAAPATLLRAEGSPTEICDASVAEALRHVVRLLRSDSDGADPAAERVAS
jgi:nicotinamide-nucleotide amidase